MGYFKRLSWKIQAVAGVQKKGLSNEAFLAVRQTLVALSDMEYYLKNTAGFKYVLLGKAQSDNLEERFG